MHHSLEKSELLWRCKRNEKERARRQNESAITRQNTAQSSDLKYPGLTTTGGQNCN